MKKNIALEKIAKKVISNTKVDTKDYGIDPITIIMVIGIILTLIRIIQECKKNRKLLNKSEYAHSMKNDIQELVLKDSWLNRLRLQKIIRKNLNKDQYKIYNKSLQNSIMETGVNLTEDEICTLTEAASND